MFENTHVESSDSAIAGEVDMSIEMATIASDFEVKDMLISLLLS
jgi:hypothetical protein